MRLKIAVVYNRPDLSRYSEAGEDQAVAGILDGVDAVTEAVNTLGHDFASVPLSPPDGLAKARIAQLQADVIFNLFEGFDGRPETEAEIARAIAGLGVPYTGCPPEALALALDKARVKELLLGAGIGTPRYQLLHAGSLDSDFTLSLPCIVKPAGEDASHGLNERSVVRNLDELRRQVEAVAARFGGQSLVEEFLGGREFNVTVMGNEQPSALPVSEIIYLLPAGLPHILTFSSKWETESVYYRGTQARCPAEIPEPMRSQIERTAKHAYQLTGCRGYARVDLRLDRDGNINVLEVNPNPDISPTSGAARQVKAAGMSYPEFIEKVLALARDAGRLKRKSG